MSSPPSNSWAVKSTAFFLKICGFWPAESKFGKRIMDTIVVYTISAIIGTLGFTIVDLTKTYGNVNKFAYSSMNLITGIFDLFKIVSFTLKRRSFLDLVRFTKDNFLNIEYDEYGAAVMKEHMNRLTKIVTFAIFICHLILFIHLIRPLIDDQGKNETDRTFPFTLYSDLPITSTPWYEILYILQVLAVYPCCYCYFSFDNFLCQMNITAVAQFAILHKKILDICDDKNKLSLSDDHHIQARFVSCVQKHQQLIAFVENIKELYRSVMIGVVIILSLLICLEMFQLMTSNESDALSTLHYCVYVGGSIAQLFFYTLTSDNLTSASLALSDAAYDVQWFRINSGASKKRLVKDLSMVIIRSQKPCSLTVGGFAPVNLQTFTSICHTAFSFLALIRQTLQNDD